MTLCLARNLTRSLQPSDVSLLVTPNDVMVAVILLAGIVRHTILFQRVRPNISTTTALCCELPSHPISNLPLFG